MPFNGAGVYSAPASPGAFNPATAGGSADPTSWNALLTDIQTGLSTTICRDGQSTITQNIPFSTKKITGLGPGTALTDAANVSQIVSASLTGAADTGAANAYAIAPTVAISAYAAYQSFQFVAANANTTTSTLAVSGLAVKTIKRPNGDNLSANDILAGAMCDVVYDGTNFVLIAGGNSDINDSLLTTRGDIIYRGASLPTRLAIGANHTFLKSNGTDPGYAAVDVSTADITGVLPIANGGTGNSSIAGANWTPTDASGAGLSFTSVSAQTVQVGNMVYAYFSLTYPATADVSSTLIGGLPVTAPNANYANCVALLQNSGASVLVYGVVVKNTKTFGLWSSAAQRFPNSQMTGITLSGVIIYPAS